MVANDPVLAITFTSPAFRDPEAVLRDADADVRIDAVDSSLVVLVSSVPDAAVRIDAVDSNLVVLVSRVPDADVNTDAVLSRLDTLEANEAEVSDELDMLDISTPLYAKDPVNVALCINICYDRFI